MAQGPAITSALVVQETAHEPSWCHGVDSLVTRKSFGYLQRKAALVEDCWPSFGATLLESQLGYLVFSIMSSLVCFL